MIYGTRPSEQLSTRSLQIAHNCLVRAIRHAEADDLVGRNVAALVRPPAGHEAGRPRHSQLSKLSSCCAQLLEPHIGCTPTWSCF